MCVVIFKNFIDIYFIVFAEPVYSQCIMKFFHNSFVSTFTHIIRISKCFLAKTLLEIVQ